MKYKILIVEDDKFLRDMMVKKFIKSGFDNVESLSGGAGVIKKVREYKPDMLLLDVNIPDISGFEILKLMREDEEIKDTNVMMLSNLSKQSDIDKSVEFGCVDYMIKAITSPQEIVDKVYAFLESNQANSK